MSVETADVFVDLPPGTELRTSVAFDVPASSSLDGFEAVELHDSLLSPGGSGPAGLRHFR
jgi:hypothetical protein